MKITPGVVHTLTRTIGLWVDYDPSHVETGQPGESIVFIDFCTEYKEWTILTKRGLRVIVTGEEDTCNL